MKGCQYESSFVESRGKVDLVYSTTSGTSKRVALKLQDMLQLNNYVATISNIGDLAHEDYLHYRGTIIFLLSTYGDGNSPSDGEKFEEWILKADPNNYFSYMYYAIIAFGNKSFKNHCGFGLKTEKFLKRGGAKQLLELTMCDASTQTNNCDSKFPRWSQQLLKVLNENNPVARIPKSQLGSPFTARLSDQLRPEWEAEASKLSNLGGQFSTYLNMHKCRVLSISQMRKKNDGRSTLLVKIQVDKSIQLWPACNIDVFPQNELQQEPEDGLLVRFQATSKKIPFPVMPYRQIRRLVNYGQTASNKQIKNAILLSRRPDEIGEAYSRRLRQEKQIKVTCRKLIEDLCPSVQFMAEVGLNSVRTYTLSSWDQHHNTIDLCVSLAKDGLTSNYFKRRPQILRIRSSPSNFTIPLQKTPILMIANGSGIAPFRSVVQYYASVTQDKRPSLKLYFGIQDESVDYYFDRDWKQWQQKQIVEVKLAQSRKDPNNKQYVQNILEKDLDKIVSHLFSENGLIYICGGSSMFKDVNAVIFKALTIHTKMPYKAYSLSSELKRKRIIVEEVFG